MVWQSVLKPHNNVHQYIISIANYNIWGGARVYLTCKQLISHFQLFCDCGGSSKVLEGGKGVFP